MLVIRARPLSIISPSSSFVMSIELLFYQIRGSLSLAYPACSTHTPTVARRKLNQITTISTASRPNSLNQSASRRNSACLDLVLLVRWASTFTGPKEDFCSMIQSSLNTSSRFLRVIQCRNSSLYLPYTSFLLTEMTRHDLATNRSRPQVSISEFVASLAFYRYYISQSQCSKLGILSAHPSSTCSNYQ